MKEQQLAEGHAARAAAELVGDLFPRATARERAELLQRVRGPVLAAVLGFAAARPRLLRRRGVLSLKPSEN